jgi:transglutaminase-like putative cysteine protease
MKIHIEHTTSYRYARPVVLNPHLLMLVPRSSHELRLLDRSLQSEPQASVEWTLDVFGNVIGTASFDAPVSQLTLKSEVTVEQSAAAWPVFSIAPEAHSFPFHYSESDRLDLGAHFLPRYEDPDGRLRSWAEAFVYSRPTDTLSLLKDINSGIGATVAYRTRDEEGTQTPLQTIDLGSGSCRDMAALFIDGVRSLGFGTRAVSGYLFDPDARGNGATHAWAEVYLPGAGWVAFDPTQSRIGSASLVPVAVGRCNEQILPVRGTYAGEPEDFIEMTVHVEVRTA